MFDIQSIDPAFGGVLLEFQAIVEGKSQDVDLSFRSSKIEDLCIDFTLPGYPDYVHVSACSSKMVSFFHHKTCIHVEVFADNSENSQFR